MYICVKLLSKIVPTINIYWMVWWTESHLHSFSRGFKCRRRCYGEFRRTYRVSVSAHFPLNGHKNATRPKLSESVPSSSRGLRHPQSLSRLVFVAHFFPPFPSSSSSCLLSSGSWAFPVLLATLHQPLGLISVRTDCPPFLCALPPRQHTPPKTQPCSEDMRLRRQGEDRHHTSRR